MKQNFKITKMQQLFADEWIISGNATDAARKSGYAEKTATQKAYTILDHPNVQAYIKDRMKEHDSKMIADQEEVLLFLTKTMRGETVDYEDTVDGRMMKQFAKDRVKAAELLGKRYMLWTEKVQMEATVASVMIVDDIPDE